MTHSLVQKTTQLCRQPGYNTQDYDCYHEIIVTHRVWSFVDMSGIRSQKATTYVHLTEYDTLTHTEDILIISPAR